jgi:hypothetical protein
MTSQQRAMHSATGGFTLVGLICIASLPLTSVLAQPAPPSAAPQVRIDAQAPSAPVDDASALAAKLQNPIADLISVPFQNNINFNVGPHQGTQDILNIQPVIPIHLNPDWNVITRTILPLVWNPSYQPAASVPPFGLSATSFSAFLSPTKMIDGWTFGGGVIAQLPTITNKTLGSNVWGLGPAVVAVRMAHPWVYGMLVNTVFSLGGTTGPGRTSYTLSWLRVSGTAKRPEIDQCERHQFHAVVPLLFELKAQQNPLEFVLPREGALHA